MLDLTGQTLSGRYRIDGLIGRGGMADVYKAWDSSRQYDVAIKVMREDLAEDLEFVDRFRREAQALSRLSHANIVRFYSFERDDLLAFIVMDYVDGTTLRAEIARAKGPMPVDEVTDVIRQIASAVHYAHTENVLHRDIKPGNIMIRPDGTVLVTDFGIAKAADSATATTVMPGTPAYMSPEQCRSEPLDVRTDVYSLGIVTYEMLGGRRPFVGDSPEANTGSTREKLRWEQMHAAPPSLAVLNPEVTPELEAVVFRALAKDRDLRWPDVLSYWQRVSEAAGGKASVTEVAPTVAIVPPTPVEPPVAGGERTPEPVVDEGDGSVPSSVTGVPAHQRLPPWVWAIGGVMLALLVIGAVALAGNGNGGRGETGLPAPDVEATVALAMALTQTADPVAAITSANARQVEQLARLGKAQISALAYSPDGRLLAVGGSIGVHLYDAATLNEVSHIPSDSSVYSVAFAPDGQTLASGSWDGTVRLWDAGSGRLLQTLEGHTSGVRSVAYAPDGRTLASGSWDGTVRLWDAGSGRLLQTLEGHTDWVSSVAFAPDGQTLASGSTDGTVRLWDAGSGRLLQTLEGHTDWVRSMAFAPDGETLASGSGDGTVRLWGILDR